MSYSVHGDGGSMHNAHSAQWWLADEQVRHERVLDVVRHIRMNQEYRKLSDLLNASLYGMSPVTGFGLGSSRRFAPTSRLTLNVIRNMVGAVASKIAAKNKPKPTFLTEDGNAELREQAEKLEQFVGGVFYESGVYAELTDCFRDACIFGTGFLKTFEDGGKVCVERVRPMEIVVDDIEAADGKPRNLYQRKYVDRLVLEHLWASGDGDEEEYARRAIAACPRDPEDTEYAYQTTADQVLVTEAWHLGEDDRTMGRHSIVIEGCTLLDEEWEGGFPFAVLRWSKDIEGFFGVGLAEELRGIQAEINKLLQQIQRGHHLIAGHWLVMQGSTVATQLNNDLAAIVKYTGREPKYEAPSIIAPEVYQHLWQLYAKAFEVSGISQLNASGVKPAGLDSGEAQRVYQDIQTERFLEVGQAYEEFVVEAARQVVRTAKRIGSGYTVRNVEGNSITAIDWGDVEIDEQDYVIRVYPTSLLPTTPAGKLAWAQDMIKAGMIPPEDVLDIVDFPDTKAYAKRRNAARTSLTKRLTKMVKTGVAISPEPFDDLKLALPLARDFYHECVNDGVDEDRVELVRVFITNVQALQKKLAAPPPAPAPMGVPGPGPQGPQGPALPGGEPGLPPMPMAAAA